MTSSHASSEPVGFELVQQLGISKVAKALRISASGVRQWRTKGVPRTRKAKLVALARAEGLLLEQEQDPAADDEVAAVVEQVGALVEAARAEGLLSDQDEEQPPTEDDIEPADPAEEDDGPVAGPVASVEASVSQTAEQAAAGDVSHRPANDTPRRRRMIDRWGLGSSPGGAPAEAQQTMRPVRLNRRTVMIVGAVLVSALALGLSQGLRQVSGSTNASRAAPTDQELIYQPQPSTFLPPFSYADVAPPAATEPTKAPEPVATTPAAANRPDPAARQRSQEEEEALRSPLFPPGALALRAQAPAVGQRQSQLAATSGQASSAWRNPDLVIPSPQNLFPGGQPTAAEQREAFLNRRLDDTIYLKNGLQKPFSDYEVKAGTIIPAALITGLNSDLPGEIIGQVTEHVYDTVTGRHLLIPQGAKIFGRYNAQVSYGQDRAQIVWDRLIMPNGKSVQLEAMVGTDKAGYAGLKDEVDHHLGRLFGAVILSSIISVGANLATDSAGEDSLVDDLGDSAAQQAATVGSQIVGRQLDVQPTITVRPGFRLNILVNKDMILEPARG